MARLKHRDIRIRRRAVRTLFEHDDPSVLEAFKPLLDDEDTWFVSKALDAYRTWGVISGGQAIEVLLSHRNLDVRRAGANLLAPLGQQGDPVGGRDSARKTLPPKSVPRRWRLVQPGPYHRGPHVDFVRHDRQSVR